MKLKNRGGFFEQIQGKINPVLVDHYYGPRIKSSSSSFSYLVQVMEAHIVMLGEEKIIPSHVASKLLRAMAPWRKTTPSLNPSLEDLYINLEKLITEKTGEEVAGYLPVARSRNDVEAAMWRIELREKLLELADSLVLIIHTLHTRAQETVNFLFPGYTYGQQAQPITMGHHLLGLSSALLRDISRIFDCIDRFNQNPLGSAAMCGTTYPINRERTAKLLGFDGVWEHTSDAIASADYMIESAGASINSLVTLSRLSEDIIWWCSNEASFADLPNDLIDSSSIMPQKRNPVICATVRSQARIAAGKYAGLCAACSVGFQASRDVTVAWKEVLECIQISNSMTRISEIYIRTIRFHKETMEASLALGFSNATELADTLVLEGKLPFRAAHKIVGGAISDLFAEGKKQEALTWELLNNWSLEISGIELPITPEQVAQAKDYRVGVERRNCQGGTSQHEILRMLQLQQSLLDQLEKSIHNRRNRWQKASELLNASAAQIMASV